MKKQMRKTFTAAMGIVLTVSMLVFPARADQPFMRAAKDNLEDAMKYLKKATADKGGHRNQAMSLVSDAISSVEDGIKYDRNNYTPGKRRRNNDFAELNFTPVLAFGDQPNMEKAKRYLSSALGNLNRASADKGGHREKAIRLINEAFDEVNAGIEYDRTH